MGLLTYNWFYRALLVGAIVALSSMLKVYHEYNSILSVLLQAANGHEECVEALIHNGADASVRDVRGRTPVHMAALCGHVSPMGSLLMQVNEADSLLDNKDYTPLHWACYNGEDVLNSQFTQPVATVWLQQLA